MSAHTTPSDTSSQARAVQARLLRSLPAQHRLAEVSEGQWRDIIGMVEVQAESLEWGYLKHWAEHWGVMDLLERAREQAGIT